jgi:carboxypeptidase Taq
LIARSREFLGFLAPLLRDAFPAAFGKDARAFHVDNLYRTATHVQRSLIRVEADEVTYPLHIMLRYEIERDLIARSVEPEHLPELWDVKMTALLGISSRGELRNGCMQDVHWPAGLFGYFPAYTLGALTACQLFEAARQQIGELPAQLGRGDFVAFDEFMRRAVWHQASLSPARDLLVQATGESLGTAAFKRHLQARYLDPS